MLDVPPAVRNKALAMGESASDWFLGSGLLFFELMRQTNRIAEGLRENDVSLGVELEREKDAAAIHRRIRLGVFIGMLLILFLGSLRFAMAAQGAWSAVFSSVAVACAFALFWFVSRFD